MKKEYIVPALLAMMAVSFSGCSRDSVKETSGETVYTEIANNETETKNPEEQTEEKHTQTDSEAQSEKESETKKAADLLVKYIRDDNKAESEDDKNVSDGKLSEKDFLVIAVYEDGTTNKIDNWTLSDDDITIDDGKAMIVVEYGGAKSEIVIDAPEYYLELDDESESEKEEESLDQESGKAESEDQESEAGATEKENEAETTQDGSEIKNPTTSGSETTAKVPMTSSTAPSTTAPSTTAPSTTAPTTIAPSTTAAPTTAAPTTAAPTTAAPTTAAPTTAAPTTAAPTIAPTTAAPTTAAPETTPAADPNVKPDVTVVDGQHIYSPYYDRLARECLQNNRDVINAHLACVNAERAKLGKSALVLDEQMSLAACYRCIEMKEENFFSHEHQVTGPTCYPQVMKFYVNPGYTCIGENISTRSGNLSAFYSRDQIGQCMYDLFYNSPSHYANMTDGIFTRIGIGFYIDDGVYYCTQLFAN